jgi:hypothetical protein
MVRVAMIPGIAQAKLDSKGMNARPDTEGRHAELDFVHRRLRPGKHGLKYQEQNDRKDQRSEHRVQHHGIDAIADGHPVQPVAAHQPENSAHLRLIVFDIRRARGPPYGGMPGVRRHTHAIEHGDQGSYAGRLDADGFDHGHSQFGGEPRGIDHDTLAARDIAHIEGDHHGQAQTFQAQHQAQILAQVGCIGDADDEVGLSLAGAAAEQHIGRDLLVRSQRIEAVGAGQIQYAHPQPRRGEQ